MIEIKLFDKDGDIAGTALIDDCDISLLRYGWYLGKRGYPEQGGGGSKYRSYLHHEVVGKPDPGYEVDHKNRNRLDCRRENLHFVTVKHNRENNSGQVNASSKHRGVSWSKVKKKWRAYGSVNRKYVHLGEYADELKAAEVAKQWRIDNVPNCGDTL